MWNIWEPHNAGLYLSPVSDLRDLIIGKRKNPMILDFCQFTITFLELTYEMGNSQVLFFYSKMFKKGVDNAF